AAAGAVPPGAKVIVYDVKSVSPWDDSGVKRPQIVFKFKLGDGVNFTDVVFPNPTAATELIPNFVGSPSAYFAFAVPQDGKVAPADFNATGSAYIRNVWNGSGTCSNVPASATTSPTGAGTVTGPDLDVWKVATGYTGRRADPTNGQQKLVVVTEKCDACHVALGVGPDFHAGQRNDATSCNFCHRPNQTASGWSGNQKDFVHSIH